MERANNAKQTIRTLSALSMARYNSWQNDGFVKAVSSLSDQERQQDRGAFFGSI